MVEIKREAAWVFHIYPRDHTPPHVHIVGANGQLVMTLEEPPKITGKPDVVRKYREAVDWVSENREFLKDEWKRINAKEKR